MHARYKSHRVARIGEELVAEVEALWRGEATVGVQAERGRTGEREDDFDGLRHVSPFGRLVYLRVADPTIAVAGDLVPEPLERRGLSSQRSAPRPAIGAQTSDRRVRSGFAPPLARMCIIYTCRY